LKSIFSSHLGSVVKFQYIHQESLYHTWQNVLVRNWSPRFDSRSHFQVFSLSHSLFLMVPFSFHRPVESVSQVISPGGILPGHHPYNIHLLSTVMMRGSVPPPPIHLH